MSKTSRSVRLVAISFVVTCLILLMGIVLFVSAIPPMIDPFENPVIVTIPPTEALPLRF